MVVEAAAGVSGLFGFLSSVKPPLSLTRENKMDRRIKAANKHRMKAPAVPPLDWPWPRLFSFAFCVVDLSASVSCGRLRVWGRGGGLCGDPLQRLEQ